MSTASYASIAPRIYAFKSQLLDDTRISELMRVSGIEDFVRLLKDTRYSSAIGNEQDIEKISILIEEKILEEKQFLESVSIAVAKQIIKYLNIIEEIKEIMAIVKTYLNEGPTGLERFTTRKFMPTTTKILSMLKEFTYDTREKSVQNIVKRVTEFIEDPEIKRTFSNALAEKDIQDNIALIEFRLVSMAFKKIIDIIKESKNYTGIDIKEILCPYTDFIFVQMFTNLLMTTKNLQFGQADVLSRATCILAESLKTAISTNSTLPLYQSLVTRFDLPQVKRDNVGDLDEQVEVEILKKVKKKAQRAFLSYPFTPSLAVAAYLLLEIERRNLMRILAVLKTVGEIKGYESLFIVLS